MVYEIIHELWLEVAGNPMRLLIEVAQFAILVAIVWFVAVGFGKRRGIITSQLAKRRERVGARLASASTADEDAAHAETQAAEAVKAAKAEARRIRSNGTREAKRIETEARAEADAEAAKLLRRVDEALAAESEEMRSSLREQLVEVVALASRRVLNENASPAEQREMIEHAVLEATQSDVSLLATSSAAQGAHRGTA